MGTLTSIRMKLTVAPMAALLLLVLATVSAQDTRSVRTRVKEQVQTWATIQAHCAEASLTDGSIDPEKALECKKCFATVGDWNTEGGFQRGKGCLEIFEPQTLEVCADLFQGFEDSGYDASNGLKVIECWQNTYMRSIAGKCMEATGGEDMNLALMCFMKHLTDNHQHTEKVLLGSSYDPLKPSKMQLVVESVFDEGRCIHANEGNVNRIQECTMCFNHILMKEKKLLMEAKIQKKHNLGGMDEEDYFEMGKKIGTMWAVCSDVYLAPTYSDCTENIEELVQADMSEWLTEEWRNKQKEVEGCMLLKQSEHYYKDCTAAGGEGVDGFMNFFSCAQNLTMAWVTDKRPEAIDMVSAYMRGGMMPMDDDDDEP